MPLAVDGAARDSPIVHALHRVARQESACSLVAGDGISERVFYFVIGGVRAVSAGPRRAASVGELLVETGKLTAGGLLRVAAAAQRDGSTLENACVAVGSVARDELDDTIRAKLEEDLLDLFLWSGAEVHVYDGQPTRTFYDGRFEAVQVSCDVPALMRTVLARASGWQRALGRLPCPDAFAATAAGRGAHAGSPQAALLALLDGASTTADAIARAGLREVPATDLVIASIGSGWLARVEKAGETAARDAHFRVIQSLESALAADPGAATVRARLAQAFEAISATAEAAAQWRRLGDDWRRANEFDRALDCYRRCVRVQPADFQTRELMLEVHRTRRDREQLCAEGRPLAQMLVEHGLLNRARNVMSQVIAAEPDDPALRRQLILVLLGLGETGPALVQLRELAALLERVGASSAELLDAYARIVSLDAKDGRALSRLDAIRGGGSRPRLVRITLCATSAALVLLGSWFTYAGGARRHVNAALAQARVRIGEADLPGATAVLQLSLESYGRAGASDATRNLLREIAAARARDDGVVETAGASARELDAAVGVLTARIAELIGANALEEAQALYRRHVELHGRPSVAGDTRLPLAITVLPADAEVFLAGVAAGHGPLLLTYAPSESPVLVVRCEGYAPFSSVLDTAQEPAIDVHLAKPVRWVFRSTAAIDAAPLVGDGLVYVAGRDRCVTALFVSDGAVAWRAPLGFLHDATVTPVMTADGVLVATTWGDAVCLDARSGAVVWRKRLGSPVERQPLAGGRDVVLVGANDGSICALSTAAGDALWRLPAASAASPPQPTGDGNFAFVDPSGGLVFASLATGVSSQRRVSASFANAAPVAGAGRLWARAHDETLLVLDAATGSVLRRFPVPGALGFSPAVADGVAFVVGADGSVWACRDGGELFHVRIDDVPSAAPAVAHGRVYVPGETGRLHVLDAASGVPVWRFDAGSRITATPAIVEGTIYVTTAAGELHAIEE